jgi:hypothetical protein
MALTRVWEEDEVGPELQRTFSDIRYSLDLPFVPTLFKLAAGVPDYLKILWADLGPVARSREFAGASKALTEFTQSLVIAGGWRFGNQERVLAGQKFARTDIEQVASVVAVFARAIPRIGLFARLMQRGYGGGQKGRISNGHQVAAVARLVTLHIPNEKDAGLRVWLLYNDIKKGTGARTVLSLFRAISPFPGYLASVWLDTKKIITEPSFLRAREELNRRSLGVLVGLPVRDHRALGKNLAPEQWREIEETVDGFSRLLPQFALIAAVWQRSFPQYAGQVVAA